MYIGFFEYVYCVYEVVCESYGMEDFIVVMMIGVLFDNRYMDFVREYVVAFKESGVVVSSRMYFKFLKWVMRIGEFEYVLWVNEEYIVSI